MPWIVATKTPKRSKFILTSGRSYQAKTEVTEGLQAGMVLINAGHREVTEGALVQVANRELL